MKHLSVEVAFDDESSELTLLQTFLKDVLFDSFDGDQSIYVDCFGLADTMGTILSLLVHRWVPVRVVEDHAVGSCQVDADAATAGRGNEAEDFRVKVKAVNHFLSGLYLH